MKLTFQFALLQCCLFFYTCQNEKQNTQEHSNKLDSSKADSIKIKQLDKVNEEQQQILISKYNAKDLKKLNFKFSILYQNLTQDTTQSFFLAGKLKDIYKKDGNLFIKIHAYIYTSILTDVELNETVILRIKETQYKDITETLKSNEKSQKGIFIIRVMKVTYLTPKIETEIENQGSESTAYYYYDYDNSTLSFEGRLIDYYLLKKSNN